MCDVWKERATRLEVRKLSPSSSTYSSCKSRKFPDSVSSHVKWKPQHLLHRLLWRLEEFWYMMAPFWTLPSVYWESFYKHFIKGIHVDNNGLQTIQVDLWCRHVSDTQGLLKDAAEAKSPDIRAAHAISRPGELTRSPEGIKRTSFLETREILPHPNFLLRECASPVFPDV